MEHYIPHLLQQLQFVSGRCSSNTCKEFSAYLWREMLKYLLLLWQLLEVSCCCQHYHHCPAKKCVGVLHFADVFYWLEKLAWLLCYTNHLKFTDLCISSALSGTCKPLRGRFVNLCDINFCLFMFVFLILNYFSSLHTNLFRQMHFTAHIVGAYDKENLWILKSDYVKSIQSICYYTNYFWLFLPGDYTQLPTALLYCYIDSKNL